MLNIRIPAYYILLSILVTALSVFFIFSIFNNNSNNRNPQTSGSAYVSSNNCKIERKRLSGYAFVKPLIYADKECEAEELAPIKERMNNAINLAKNEGLISSASVYLRVFNNGNWTTIEPEQKFHPASLNKVPILITYMRMVESNNRILDEKIRFVKEDTTLPREFYKSKNIKSGNSYTVKELLHNMIAYSDNNATLLLMQHMNLDIYNKVFTDLGLDKPSFNFDEFQLNAKEYSLFFRVLYNGSYLSVPASEYALEILADCDFKEGLVKQIPATVKVAHKFGESGYGNTYELHESGIVYIGDKSYLLTVMTKGTDLKKQATAISNISSQVYNAMTAMAL